MNVDKINHIIKNSVSRRFWTLQKGQSWKQTIIPNKRGTCLKSQLLDIRQIWRNQPIHLFFLGCLNACLQGISVRIVCPIHIRHMSRPTYFYLGKSIPKTDVFKRVCAPTWSFGWKLAVNVRTSDSLFAPFVRSLSLYSSSGPYFPNYLQKGGYSFF